MPLSRLKSDLLVDAGPSKRTTRKFICRYELDERIDRDLANLTQVTYRSLQSFLGDRVNITVNTRQGVTREPFPDPAQAWVIYCTSLIHGAADAAVTLAVHNLGREARILARQIFEYVFKSQYFCTHPLAAKRELETEPFRELWLLEDLGYDRRARRYRDLKRECAELARKRPALAAYAKKTRRKEPPSVPKSMGRGSRRSKEMYALHYRMPSQTLHAGVLGMRDVITEEGIQFDSRETYPNYVLIDVCRYVIVFARILNSTFSLNKGKEIGELVASLKPIEKRLTPQRGQG